MAIRIKKFALTVFFSFSVLLASPSWATTYFMAPASGGGSDSNSGTSASSPWLSPNHSVNCGDVILAAAGAYATSNFQAGKWGTVSCPGNNNVAWVKCATFDACKISGSSGSPVLQISKSYWGVQGFENTGTGAFNECFGVKSPSGGTVIHHIVFANDIANSCGSGFTAINNGTTGGVDYVVYVGNIAYNAAQNSDSCNSGFNIYQPIKSDSVAGTHMLVAGNFAWANKDANPCQGGTPTDGEGIILDTFDFSQGGGTAYDQQAYVTNNIVLANGGRGIDVLNNSAGSSHATVYVTKNTSWGNGTDNSQNGGGSYAEIELSNTRNTTVTGNIAQTTEATCCGGYAFYAYMMDRGNATNVVNGNLGFSATGSNGGNGSSSGFSFGTNLFGTNPNFANPSIPGAPACSSASSVTDCMAGVIANFTPTNAAAKAYGYQVPSTTSVADPLFPQWLCNANLPPGLVDSPCAAPASSSNTAPQPPTGLSVLGVQ